MIKRFLHSIKTLRVRIIAIVALCWLLPTLVLGVYMSSLFVDALRTKTEQALVSGASHAQAMTMQEIERIIKKSRDVTYDEQIADYATDYLSGSMRYEEFFILSRTYWHKLFQRERMMHLTAFFLIDEPDMLIHTSDNVSVLLDFRQNVLPHVLNIGETLDTHSRFTRLDGKLYHVRNLYTRKLERFGMMALEVDESLLFAPLLDSSALWQGNVDIALDQYVYTVSDDEPFNSASVQEGLHTLNNDLYYSTRIHEQDYTLTYRIRLDNDAVYGQVNEYYEIIIVLILLLLPLEALILLFIHRSITRPLIQLSVATKRLAEGELGITVPAYGIDEIDSLGSAFNTMSLRMRNLIDKSYREELALRDARIAALQSRINPHFLNNALELMNWQARIDGADTVSQMIESMSTLINAALDRSNQRTVPLRVELEVADAYFFFIQQRYGDRLQVEKSVDPGVLEAQVPRLVIQTLLENAVEHGIGPIGGGCIRLNAYLRGEWLIIDVCNDGAPIKPEEAENIAFLLDDANRDGPSEHIGIRNVNVRLKLIYSDDASLAVMPGPDGETIARITIPYALTMTQDSDAPPTGSGPPVKTSEGR